MDIDGYHSSTGEYASNPPPKPAHGIMRTEFSMPVPSTTYYNEEIAEANDNIVLRRKTNDAKKFVHFRESRDITYYPEIYEMMATCSADETVGFDQCNAQSPPVCPSEQNHDIGDLDMTVVSGYSSDGRALSRGYNSGYPLRMSYNDEKYRFMNQPTRNDMREETVTYPSQPAVLNSKVSRRPQYLDLQDTNLITASQTTQPKLKFRPENPADSLVSNLKLSAIGPVYVINRNTSTRSSGTFISLIGRVPIDVNKMKHSSREHVPNPIILTKNIQILQKSLANEAMDHKQNIQKSWTQCNGDYVEEEKEINGHFIEFDVNENYSEQANKLCSKDTQFKLSTDNNCGQKQILLQEYGIDPRGREVVLEENGSRDFAPEVRNTLRVKQDTVTREVHKKKSEDVYNIDNHRPDIKVDLTPSVESCPVVEYNLASTAHYTESKVNTKKLKQQPESQVDKGNNSDKFGFSRKNVKNLSIEIMGVSTESLEFEGETPLGDYYGQSSSDVNPKTTTIHRDYNDPNLSLVGSECPAVSVLTDTGNYFVIVAIDFGTMFSGYAFSFTRDPESIHMMRKWEGGDPGINNQKAPTTILIKPNGEFDSFGYAARDRYHDMDPEEAKEYMYFEKFKMTLHHNADLTKDTVLDATNGKTMSALTVFSYALRFFKEHALQELSDQSGMEIVNDDVRWVITVPAIWKAPAKQFMRQASYQAGIASSSNPEQLIIALEPEAASIYCRKLRLYQLVPDTPTLHPLTSPNKKSPEIINMENACSDLIPGMRYMVVDCGGGTVDITVHELESSGLLRELYKATGGAFGGTGIDMEFVNLMCNLFGRRFIDQFKSERPVGWMDMMIAFESRKRSASPYKSSPLNISLPFSFIDYYKKVKKSTVESAIKRYNNPNIRWSTQGMLRLSTEEMQRLFKPTLTRISEAIGNILNNPEARDLKYLFLVGGFAESHMLQHFIRREFGDILKVIIPQGVGMSILKGAVLYGQNPSVISVRRSRLTYGVGVLNRYDENKHPKQKLFSKDGMDWCSDVFDKFVVINQPLKAGETVIRSYTPAKIDQKLSIINIYASDDEDVKFITDASVRKCGTLSLDLSTEVPITPSRREIKTIMSFGDTEIRMAAIDVITGKSVKAFIDFLD